MQEFQCFDAFLDSYCFFYLEMTRIKSNMNQNDLIQIICCLSYLEMTWEVLLVEGMVVNLDLGESSEVIWHEHDRHVDVLQLPKSFYFRCCSYSLSIGLLLCFLQVFLTRALQ